MKQTNQTTKKNQHTKPTESLEMLSTRIPIKVEILLTHKRQHGAHEVLCKPEIFFAI